MSRRGATIVALGTVLGLVTVAGAGLAAAQQAKMSASDAWVKLPASGDTTAVACVAVNNPTMYDAYLISATTEAAEKVEFRRSEDESVAELTVAAYGGLTMTPDGVHMVLTDLKHPLADGDTIPITIRTDGEPLSVTAVVRKEE